VVSYIRADSVEIVDDDDMREAYQHGYFGKGTVSRRVPNKAMVVPPELLSTWMHTAATTRSLRKVMGSDERYYDPAGVAAAAAARSGASREAAAAAAAAATASSSSSSSSSTTASAAHAAAAEAALAEGRIYADDLTVLADEFEAAILSIPLPNAYECAAAATSHGHDPLSFEDARRVAHYVSCPPPRLRHVKTVKKEGAEDGAAGAARGGAEGEGSVPAASAPAPAPSPAPAPVPTSAAPQRPATAIRFEHMVFETSILEPEAAVYLLARAPGRFAVLATPEWEHETPGAAPGSGASGGPLTLQQVWSYFCARLRNFPARAAVYASCRDRGYVVRDGHAFGADFVLYPHGPGMGHALACVVVMPLKVRRGQQPGPGRQGGGGGGGGAGPSSSSSSTSPSAPSPVLAPSPGAVMSCWLQAHGHGRVIQAVRKAFVLAYTAVDVDADAAASFAAYESLLVSGGGGGAGTTIPFEPDLYPEPVAAVLRDPMRVFAVDAEPGVVQPVATSSGESAMAVDGDPSSSSSSAAPASAPAVPAPPRIVVKLQAITRWVATKEHKVKNDALMAHVAALEAMQEAYAVQRSAEEEGDEEEEEVVDGGEDGGPALEGAADGSAKAPKQLPKPATKQHRQMQMRAALAAVQQKQMEEEEGRRGDAGGPAAGDQAGAARAGGGPRRPKVEVTAMVLAAHLSDAEAVRAAAELIARELAAALLEGGGGQKAQAVAGATAAGPRGLDPLPLEPEAGASLSSSAGDAMAVVEGEGGEGATVHRPPPPCDLHVELCARAAASLHAAVADGMTARKAAPAPKASWYVERGAWAKGGKGGGGR
jgi:hypothetical protein